MIDMSSSPTVGEPWIYDPAMPSAEGNLCYRLEVLTQNVRDVVKEAGGWLFDLSKAGWDVTVIVLGPEETRPFRILGLNVIELNRSAVGSERRPYPHVLAIAPDLLAQDPNVKRRSTRAMKARLTEVVLYGVSQQDEGRRGDDVMLHQLTRAARVFKDCALAVDCNSQDASGDGVEIFQPLHLADTMRLEGATCRGRADVMSLAFGPRHPPRRVANDASVRSLPFPQLCRDGQSG